MGYLRALPAKMEQEVQDHWTRLSICSYAWYSQFVQSGQMMKGWALSSPYNKQMGGVCWQSVWGARNRESAFSPCSFCIPERLLRHRKSRETLGPVSPAFRFSLHCCEQYILDEGHTVQGLSVFTGELSSCSCVATWGICIPFHSGL